MLLKLLYFLVKFHIFISFHYFYWIGVNWITVARVISCHDMVLEYMCYHDNNYCIIFNQLIPILILFSENQPILCCLDYVECFNVFYHSAHTLYRSGHTKACMLLSCNLLWRLYLVLFLLLFIQPKGYIVFVFDIIKVFSCLNDLSHITHYKLWPFQRAVAVMLRVRKYKLTD